MSTVPRAEFMIATGAPCKPVVNPATASLRALRADAIRNAIRAKVGQPAEGMVCAAWSWIHGLGLFAARPLPRACIVLTGRVVQSGADPDPGWTFTLRPGWHAWLSPEAGILNHSCAPNLGIVDLGKDGYAFRTLREIAVGEELTRDYGCTEGFGTGIAYCHCGAAACTGAVPGFFESTAARTARLRGFGVAQWIREFEAARHKRNRRHAA
jgi:SET domain